MTENADTPAPPTKKPRLPRLDDATARRVRALWTGQNETGEKMPVFKIAETLGVPVASVKRIVKEVRHGIFSPGFSDEQLVKKAAWEAQAAKDKPADTGKRPPIRH